MENTTLLQLIIQVLCLVGSFMIVVFAYVALTTKKKAVGPGKAFLTTGPSTF